MALLTSLANVKTFMDLKSNENDDLLKRMILSTSTFVEKWLGRSLLSASQSESRDGTGSTYMPMKNWPITEVTSVTVDGVSVPVGAITFDETSIYLTGYRFARGRNNVVVSYTAGYPSTPSDIEQAIIDTIFLRMKERERFGQANKSLAGETVTFIVSDFTKSAISILNLYKRTTPL